MNPKTEWLLRMQMRLNLMPLYIAGFIFVGSVAGSLAVWAIGYFDRLSR